MSESAPQPAPKSAVPTQAARVVAFAAVLVGGLFGGLIGAGLSRFECEGSCHLWSGLALFGGSVIGALGLAVVVVVVLRAQGEWYTIRAEHG